MKNIRYIHSEYEDITQHQLQGLRMKYNLSDAHTHQSQSPSQRKIVESLPELWYRAEQSRQCDVDQKFIETFFRVQRQYHAVDGKNTLIVYAASIAMVIIANYLMKKNMTVSLIEPCFDNLPDILKHMGIELSPLKEEWLNSPDTLYDNLEQHITSDAILIVDPNNPTGTTLFKNGKKTYEELFRFAKDHNKLLIFDFCFASFTLPDDNIEMFDWYELVDTWGVSYIAMEDTGKTWPVQDTKAALMKMSDNIFADIYNIHTAYLLNVSPFILSMLTEYMIDSEKHNFAATSTLLERNYNIIKRELSGSLLEVLAPQTKVSVAWLKIKNPSVKASELQKYIIDKYGVYILPGTYFFWSDHEQGESFLRVALARDTEMFEPAIKLLRQAIDTYEKTFLS